MKIAPKLSQKRFTRKKRRYKKFSKIHNKKYEISKRFSEAHKNIFWWRSQKTSWEKITQNLFCVRFLMQKNLKENSLRNPRSATPMPVAFFFFCVFSTVLLLQMREMGRSVCLALVLCFGLVLTVVPPSERQALVDFYTSLQGQNWTGNANWLTGDPCENAWGGVFCEFVFYPFSFISLANLFTLSFLYPVNSAPMSSSLFDNNKI